MPATSTTSIPASTPSPRTRSTAEHRAALTPFTDENDGTDVAFPCPQSQISLAASPNRPTTSRDASISARTFGAAGPVGQTAGFPVRSWGGVQSASAHDAGATTMWRYSTPGWNDTSSDPSASWRAATTGAACSDVGWPPAKSTITPSSTRDRLQR